MEGLGTTLELPEVAERSRLNVQRDSGYQPREIEQESRVPLDLSPESSTESKAKLSFSDRAQALAELVCSRESIFRATLDLTGWELPNIIASASRNIYSFAESILQSFLTLTLNYGAPWVTKQVTNFLAKYILKEDEAKEINNYMLFQLRDFEDQESFEKGVKRIMAEEPEDILFNASLSRKSPEQMKNLEARAGNIKEFFGKLEFSQDLFERLKKHKRATILGESMVEGFGWGSFILLIRLFRKYVLGQNRFTGTTKYASDEESKKLGDTGDMKWWQKLGTVWAMISSPTVNYFLLNKIKDKEAVKNNKWLQVVKNQWDMTHGIFPRLGLMLSYIQIPAMMGRLFTAQGRTELLENLMILGGMVPSWWFGHRITNGILAKIADSAIVKKFGIKPGVFVEPSYLGHPAPEAAKIHHVIKSTEHDPELEKYARKKHAQVLFGGFTLHSLLVFMVRMLINQVTKWRVQSKLKSSHQTQSPS